MTLMEQCRIWKEEKNYQKMISALEALSAGERTPELDSEAGAGVLQQRGYGEQRAVPEGSEIAETP